MQVKHQQNAPQTGSVVVIPFGEIQVDPEVTVVDVAEELHLARRHAFRFRTLVVRAAVATVVLVIVAVEVSRNSERSNAKAGLLQFHELWICPQEYADQRNPGRIQ